ncbi:MAG: PEP-CTERM sorting domain-containing protein [Gemmatimonadota bacterium]|nr:MAG: PEP-CTERM sorting domain-containing protein [Gemmatimonadota bacterium]
MSPQIARWRGDGHAHHDPATIAILNISVPEPSGLLLLAAGVGVLTLLHRASRRV